MSELGAGERVLVLQLHNSRKRARAAAVAELVALLEDLGGRPLPGGPLSEIAGTAWAAVRSTTPITELSRRLLGLGYSESVRLAVPEGEAPPDAGWTPVRWRGKNYALAPIFEEAISELQQDSPDQRSFLLECGDGVVRRIEGYRGGRGPLEHRALPVTDARLLVNLLGPARGGLMLDPFAGAGGVLLFGRRAGWNTISVDNDKTLRFGLKEIAHTHVVADAAYLPFKASSFHAIATEPPYHPMGLERVKLSIREAARVLRDGGRMSMLVAAKSATEIEAFAHDVGFHIDLRTDIDRKGTPVTCLRMALP